MGAKIKNKRRMGRDMKQSISRARKPRLQDFCDQPLAKYSDAARSSSALLMIGPRPS